VSVRGLRTPTSKGRKPKQPLPLRKRESGLAAEASWGATAFVHDPFLNPEKPSVAAAKQPEQQTSNWSIPYYLDVGTGSSAFTRQGMLGVAYSFHWGDVTLAYRNLYYDQGSDKLIQNMRFDGFALGVTFRF
jgi:hypothetical protein